MPRCSAPLPRLHSARLLRSSAGRQRRLLLRAVRSALPVRLAIPRQRQQHALQCGAGCACCPVGWPCWPSRASPCCPSHASVHACPLMAGPQIESGGVTHEHTRKWLYLQELQVGWSAAFWGV